MSNRKNATTPVSLDKDLPILVSINLFLGFIFLAFIVKSLFSAIAVTFCFVAIWKTFDLKVALKSAALTMFIFLVGVGIVVGNNFFAVNTAIGTVYGCLFYVLAGFSFFGVLSFLKKLIQG